jgi:hypothetical protein
MDREGGRQQVSRPSVAGRTLKRFFVECARG